MKTDDGTIVYNRTMGNDPYIHTLENLKIIGMVGGYEDTKISGFLSHLFRSTGKKAARIHSTGCGHDTQKVRELLSSHMDTYNGELEYAVIHLPGSSPQQYDLSNIFLDSIIHTFLGENNKYENDKSETIFKSLSAKGYALINVDDEAYPDFIGCLENKLVITYGLSPKATITASSIEEASNLHFTCCIQRGITNRSGLEVDPMEFPVYIPNFEKSDIHSALAAIGTGLIYGISTEDIITAFKAHGQTGKTIKYESR
ncbi:Mur ligase family protein [Anaerosolibacter sp.]|uniref:Mur ligase family protein n=1 Tax=Anaerosolibacter sp. TaxID=1872527 RepID=UPI0039EFE99D